MSSVPKKADKLNLFLSRDSLWQSGKRQLVDPNQGVFLLVLNAVNEIWNCEVESIPAY